jgi:cytochrome c peroxidase
MKHIANALSAFERFEFRADNSPFDRYLRGDQGALSELQVTGMNIFYQPNSCGSCHRGVLQTDHQFHNIGIPFVGPGRTRRFDFKARDMGRINETDYAEDAYRFRTPSLRNITETAPYGHNGAYAGLKDMVKHHLQPMTAFENYDIGSASLPQAEHIKPDTLLWADRQERQRMASTLTTWQAEYSETDIQALLAFLSALTDEGSIVGRLGIPDSVPSGLPVER